MSQLGQDARQVPQKGVSRKLAGLVTISLGAVSEAPTSEELGVEALWEGASDTALRLLARNDFRVARDLGVVERMLRSQVRAAICTVGLRRTRCTEDTDSGC
jgi:hypothetical protein